MKNNSFFSYESLFGESFDPFARRKPEKKELTCDDCGLYRVSKSPMMGVTGRGKLRILIVAEASGPVEDEEGIQFVGTIGQELRKVLDRLGYDLDRDFWKVNAVRCFPRKKEGIGFRTPNTKEINACRKYLFEAIDEYKPVGIIIFGDTAYTSLLGQRLVGRIKGVSFTDFTETFIPDQMLKMWVCPIFHPSFVVRDERNIVLRAMWENNIAKAIKKCLTPFYEHNYDSDIFIITDINEAIERLREAVVSNDPLSFDYETTGLKPHREGQKIISVSISDGMFAWAFPFFSENRFFVDLWKSFLKKENIIRIVQNAGFERMWSQTVLGQDICGQIWDTKLAAHSLDNRKNCGEKFLTFVNFGVVGYDEKVDDYITGHREGEDEKTANAFNLIDKCNMEELLKYNAKDSLFCHKLYTIQKAELFPFLQKGYDFFTEGSVYLVQAQQNGVRLNLPLLYRRKKEIEGQLVDLEIKIRNSDGLKNWNKETKFDLKSAHHLRYLLFNILKINSGTMTRKGSRSVDKNTLKTIDLPFVKDLLQWRRWYKALHTYIAQFEREQINGIFHSFFNLHTVVTFRSSSSSPNLQNLPKRDSEIMSILRSLVIPREGNRFISWDYKQIEVCVAACHTKDPVLIKYVSDPNSDMHKDEAVEIFLKDRKDISDKERYLGKNGFVFPEFYGDYYAKIAPIMWGNIPDETKEHLANKGIKTMSDFTFHLQGVERKFWEKFHVYADWKWKLMKDYERNGYIDLYTGFRCWGPVKRNELINRPIQGTAFHILLYMMINVMKRTKDIKRSFVIGEIHDDMMADVHPDDESLFDSLVLEWGIKRVREHWDWIIVPLVIEKTRSEVNGSWEKMEKCGYLGLGE